MKSRRRVNSAVMPLMLNESSIDQVLKAAGLIGAIGAFVVGLLQYRRAQKWKRAEWVAQEMKRLFDDPVVQNLLLMLDWGRGVRVRLYPDELSLTKQYVVLTDEDVARALMVHEDRPDKFNDREADIRTAFDRFLNGIERFHAYVQTGLITVADVSPYLSYWAHDICEKTPGDREKRLVKLRIYMEKYGYSGAYALLQKIARHNKSLDASRDSLFRMKRV